jgi:hypothetical protein
MQSRKTRDKNRERTRNFILVILAVGMVVFFFNLDMVREGESIFSRNAEQKLSFAGDLDRRAFTQKEVDRLLAFVRRHDALLENVTIETSLQDRYRSVGPSTELLFEIRMTTTDGGTISAPTRRALRKNLVQAVLAKLDKDIRAYIKVNEDNDKVKSLVNTM